MAAAALALGAVSYAYYPRLEGPVAAGPALVAAATLALLLGACLALRR